MAIRYNGRPIGLSLAIVDHKRDAILHADLISPVLLTLPGKGTTLVCTLT